MSFRKAVSFGALQTAASLLVGFAAVKITSFYLGPSGVAIMGQLQYFMGMVSGGVMNGLRNGLVRRTSELASEPELKRRHVASVLRTVVCIGLPVSVLIIVFSGWLAQELLHGSNLWPPLVLFGVAYVPGLVGAVMLACAVGAKSYKTSASVNIANGVINVSLFGLLCPSFGLFGALVAVALMPLLNSIVIRWYATRSPWWPKQVWHQRFEMSEARKAIAFIPAATITSVGTPLVHILLRDDLAAAAGIDAVGLVHGMTRLSDMGASVLWGLFGLYFAPRFAEIKTRQDVSRELLRAQLLFMPALVSVSILIYLFRDQLIVVIFTKDFAAMRDLFAWQLCGTCLRIFGGLFGLVMMAKANPIFIASYEAFTLLVWFACGKILIESNGAVGASQAFALNYAVYAAIVVCAALLVIRRLPSRPVH